MNFSEDKINRLRELIGSPDKNIAIVTHTNPDGDAIGSSLAWATILRRRGHNVSCIIPNRVPAFLEWMDGIDTVKIYKSQPDEATRLIEQAEIIFCLDFNQINRLDGIGQHIENNKDATLVLIDHHLEPPPVFDLEISYAESSSTSFLVYELIDLLEGLDAIDKSMAEQIYVGIMTDTGNFSYSFLTPDLFRAVAVLVEKGVDIPYINKKIYHSFSADRIKLLGYSLCKMETMEVGEGNEVAWIGLKGSDLRKFNFQLGDSEGFVNYPLSIRGLAMSAMFIESRDFIRISFRSRIDVNVSEFARRYFNGGGHKNAAGGKSFVSLAETIEEYKRAAIEYFSED